MFIPRDLIKKVHDSLRQFPVVCILGLRQAGKTTLAKMSLPKADIWDLELPSDRQRLELDPEEMLRQATPPSVLDEAAVVLIE